MSPSTFWRGSRRRCEIPTSRRTFKSSRNQSWDTQFGFVATAAQTPAAPAHKMAAAARGSISKSWRNSSSGTPSESQSNSCWTGSRVPRKQGTPLIRAGSTHTACSKVIGWLGFDEAKVFTIRAPLRRERRLGMILRRRIQGNANASRHRSAKTSQTTEYPIRTTSPGCDASTGPTHVPRETAGAPYPRANAAFVGQFSRGPEKRRTLRCRSWISSEAHPVAVACARAAPVDVHGKFVLIFVADSRHAIMVRPLSLGSLRGLGNGFGRHGGAV